MKEQFKAVNAAAVVYEAARADVKGARRERDAANERLDASRAALRDAKTTFNAAILAASDALTGNVAAPAEVERD